MLHIAGGIILAVIILAFLPTVIALAGWAIVAALTVGAIGTAAYFIFGTETGNQLAVSLIAIAGAWFAFVIGVRAITNIAGWLNRKHVEAGGLHHALADFLIELRPTLTERQMIQKLANRRIRKEQAAARAAHKQQVARSKIEERQRREDESRNKSFDRQLKRASDRLDRKMRRLEKSFSRVVNMRFQYAKGRVTVLMFDPITDSWMSVATLSCKRPSPSVPVVTYELEAPPRLWSKGRENYPFFGQAIDSVRGVLRQAAAQNIAANR